MDKLDKLIADHRKRIAGLDSQILSLRTQRERLNVALAAYVEAAKIRPLAAEEPAAARASSALLARLETSGTVSAPEVDEEAKAAAEAEAEAAEAEEGASHSRTGGRQPGAIATQWRGLMSALVLAGNPWSDMGQIHALAREKGMDIQLPSVRGRIRKYAEMGLFDTDNDKYRVSQMAMVRFTMFTPLPPPGDPPPQPEPADELDGDDGALLAMESSGPDTAR